MYNMKPSYQDIIRATRRTINKLINEGASKVLYHYIEPDRLVRVLKNNKFYPSEPEMYYNIGDNKKEFTDGVGMRFMSFTRNKNFHSGYPVLAYGEFGSNGVFGIVCRLEIDGDALNTYNNFKVKTRHGEKRKNFKVKPFDFVYHDYGDGKGDPMRIADETGVFARNGKEWMMQSDSETMFGWDGWGKTLSDKYAHSMSQAEDRLTTTAEYIPDAKKYIKSIDIYFNEDMTVEYDEADKLLSDIRKYAKKLDIPVHMYDAPYLKDFSLSR